MEARYCRQCSADISMCHHLRRYCFGCGGSAREKATGATHAHQMVNTAVKNGLLVPAKSLSCTDCGDPADEYDHRDYGKPLDVQPVCRGCNRLRGPARPVLTFELPDDIPRAEARGASSFN